MEVMSIFCVTNKLIKSKHSTMLDLIGDIHGHADDLEHLLQKLGYTKTNTHYSHPERKVLFVGDYIDRGPKIRETLEIVKGMVDHGSAIALMGNHEYNALLFHAENPKGGHLRKHSIKNIIQHYDTLEQFKNDHKAYKMYLEWFKTLPLFYETETFRAVHACWDYVSIDYLKEHLVDNRLTEELLHQSAIEDTPLYDVIETTLKGKELRLPREFSFQDEDGSDRENMRIKWWEELSNITYEALQVNDSNIKIPSDLVTGMEDADYYKENDKPVFFGHYWLQDKAPKLFRDNICCLDYSVAKDGYLVAYRFDGETALDEDKFVYVKKEVLA